MTISLKEFFLHEENSQSYAAEVHRLALPVGGEVDISQRHLDSLEQVGVAPHAAAQIMIQKYGWQPTDNTRMMQQNNLGEHQDPTKPVDKGTSIWSDPNQPADVRKFSSCGGNLHIDLSEAPDVWWPGKDESPPDIEMGADELHPDDAPASQELQPEPTENPEELPDLGGNFGFDAPEADAGFSTPVQRDPRWAEAPEAMDWEEFKSRHPDVAHELDNDLIDSTQLAQAIFKARVGTPSTNKPGIDRSDFFSAKFPGGRQMMYVGDNRGWQDMGNEEDNATDPEDPGPEYDRPVNF